MREQMVMATDALFIKYDTDQNGYLEGNEVVNLLNDALVMKGRKAPASEKQL